MQPGERVLVFGGSGFIGSHLVRRLQEEGARVVVADLTEPKQDVPYFPCDIRQPLPESLDDQYDLVVNLAAIAKEPGYAESEYYLTNETGAGHVLDYMRRNGLKRLWFTSSMSTYGPSEDPCSEQAPQNPNTAYGGSKKNAEALHLKWRSEDPSRRLVMVRPAVIFGPGEGGNFTRLARTLKRGHFVYPGRRDTIKANGYVGDLVESLLHMDAQSDPYVLYNFCYPQTYTIQNIVEAFVRVGNLRKARGTVPKPVVLGAARLLQVANRTGLKGDIHPMRVYKLIRSTNIVPTELQKRGFQWPTQDLDGGLRTWLESAPKGEFV
jgi:nucleoside-diphosphate-sugar epimerase